MTMYSVRSPRWYFKVNNKQPLLILSLAICKKFCSIFKCRTWHNNLFTVSFSHTQPLCHLARDECRISLLNNSSGLPDRMFCTRLRLKTEIDYGNLFSRHFCRYAFKKNNDYFHSQAKFSFKKITRTSQTFSLTINNSNCLFSYENVINILKNSSLYFYYILGSIK